MAKKHGEHLFIIWLTALKLRYPQYNRYIENLIRR